ncbi:hypothetical protein S245_049562, partial [Arachis hypogaea]
AVVFIDISLKKAIEFNDFCHTHQPLIAFIKTKVRGLFAEEKPVLDSKLWHACAGPVPLFLYLQLGAMWYTLHKVIVN